MSARSREQRNRQETTTNLEIPQQNRDVSCWKRLSARAGNRNVFDGEGFEDEVMVNNIVIDNELGGREIAVLPSWKTDQVILNAVRWGGAYLCGMGKCWSAGVLGFRSDKEYGEILKSFFSSEMGGIRLTLQKVEWNMNVEDDGLEFLRIYRLGGDKIARLNGEMSAPYGNLDTSFNVDDTSTVDAYSFEFESLVGSYPATDKKMGKCGNRERIAVGLVHSVVVAKHLGVEKLKTIRRYYDRNRLPEGIILRNAFKLLLMQTNTHIPEDAKIWEMNESIDTQLPMFPYRMQMVALWDKATNWRVLQASAHQDILRSLSYLQFMEFENINVERVLHNAPRSVNIFDYCAKWTDDQLGKISLGWKGSLGVVTETVRTFLAEWISARPRRPNWKPAIPTALVEFKTRQTPAYSDYLTWICQRELKRKVAGLSSDEENLPGNAALIMLFILGFPLLQVYQVEDGEVGAQEGQDEVHQGSASSGSNRHFRIDMNVEVWRATTPLAPQDISVVIRRDSEEGTISMSLQNDSGATRFIWQDWVDAAMGCLKGFEEAGNGEQGYGRKIMRAELRKPMVEVCAALPENEETGDGVVARRSRARVWKGWPAFDVRICKFEVDQWLCVLNIDMRDRRAHAVVESVECVIKEMASRKKEVKLQASSRCAVN